MKSRKAAAKPNEENTLMDFEPMEPVAKQEKPLSTPGLNLFMVNGGRMPEYATPGSHCFDIFANFGLRREVKCLDRNNTNSTLVAKNGENAFITILPGMRALIPTGIVASLKEDQVMKIYIRSGLSFKQGLHLNNGVGIIDSDYREEIFVSVHNSSNTPINISSGDRIAQGEIVYSEQIQISSLAARPKQVTGRSGGFGSTGK